MFLTTWIFDIEKSKDSLVFRRCVRKRKQVQLFVFRNSTKHDRLSTFLSQMSYNINGCASSTGQDNFMRICIHRHTLVNKMKGNRLVGLFFASIVVQICLAILLRTSWKLLFKVTPHHETTTIDTKKRSQDGMSHPKENIKQKTLPMLFGKRPNSLKIQI